MRVEKKLDMLIKAVEAGYAYGAGLEIGHTFRGLAEAAQARGYFYPRLVLIGFVVGAETALNEVEVVVDKEGFVTAFLDTGD